jgi:hypothetical protein
MQTIEPDQLWANFLEARGRALETLQIDDAARAGRAWSAFLSAFAPLNPADVNVPRMRQRLAVVGRPHAD